MSPQALPEIAHAHLDDPLRPQALVTFLNQALKRRGLVFGIAREEGGYLLTVYETEPWKAPDGAEIRTKGGRPRGAADD